MHIDDNSLPPFTAPYKRYGHAAAILGSALLVHGGISGEDNQVISDLEQSPKGFHQSEWVLFDFQARQWVKVRQEELVNEDTGEKKMINTTISCLAYHTMTAVFDPIIARSFPDVFYSR